MSSIPLSGFLTISELLIVRKNTWEVKDVIAHSSMQIQVLGYVKEKGSPQPL